MRRRGGLLVLIILTGLSAWADIQRWWIGPSVRQAGERPLVLQEASDAALRLSVWNGENRSAVPMAREGGVWCDLTRYSRTDPEYVFVAEIVNSDRNRPGVKEEVDYAAPPPSQDGLVAVSRFEGLAPTAYVSWNSGSSDVPEPAGGLLLLLGTCILALRRRGDRAWT